MNNKVSFQNLGKTDPIDLVYMLAAGLYIVALALPSVLLILVQWLPSEISLYAISLIGLLFTTLMTWFLTQREELLNWLNSTWAAILVPILGLLPMIGHANLFFRYLAATVTELEQETAASLIGFIGFFSGLAAAFIGVVLIVAARIRFVNTSLNEDDVTIEWAAGWPRRLLYTVRLAAVCLFLALYGVVSVWSRNISPIEIIYAGIVSTLVLSSLGATHTYRVTPFGLEQRRGWILRTRRQFSWESLDGFSVTGNAIVLHRQFPGIDIRCARSDIIMQELSIIEALEDRLERKDDVRE